MRIIICDDSTNQSSKYEMLLKEIAKEENILLDISKTSSGDQLLFGLFENLPPPDIVLLDIHMPGTDGIVVADKLRRPPYDFKGEIIFITVDASRVLEAFDVEAFHYIVKNVTPVDKVVTIFKLAIKRAEIRKKEYIMLKGVGEYQNIEIDSIKYFKVFDHLIKVYYDEKQEFEFYSSMKKLEIALLSKGFLRSHRSCLVAVNKILKFNTINITLKTGEVLPMGRRYFADFKMAIINNKAVSEKIMPLT